MKNLLLMLIAGGAILVYYHRTEANPQPPVPKIPVGLILAYDISESSLHQKLDSATISGYLMRHIFDGVAATGILVLPDSHLQQPWFMPLLKADTLPLPANFIQAERQRKRNAEALTQAERRCAEAVSNLCENMLLPQSQPFSDVSGALKLCALAAHSYAARGYKPVLVLVSDMLQDIQNVYGQETIPAFEFPPETEIIIIGADPSVSLNSIFGNHPISQFPSFEHLNL